MHVSPIELKNSLPDLDLNPVRRESSARQASRHCGLFSGLAAQWASKTDESEAKRDVHKFGARISSSFKCHICHQMCHSHIGLLANNKSHLWSCDDGVEVLKMQDRKMQDQKCRTRMQ